MIGGLMVVSGALGAFALALLIFGLAPGLMLALIVKMLHSDDPRRRELQAELYVVPRWDRPFWVMDQLETALREGAFPHANWLFGRWFWHRATVESGVELNREYPDTFWIPTDDEKDSLLPGDLVKLVWSVKRSPGEKMWVTVLHRDGDRFTGELSNLPLFVHMNHGETVRFTTDDIIDFFYAEETDCADCGETHGINPKTFAVSPVCDACNGHHADHDEHDERVG